MNFRYFKNLEINFLFQFLRGPNWLAHLFSLSLLGPRPVTSPGPAPFPTPPTRLQPHSPPRILTPAHHMCQTLAPPAHTTSFARTAHASHRCSRVRNANIAATALVFVPHTSPKAINSPRDHRSTCLVPPLGKPRSVAAPAISGIARTTPVLHRHNSSGRRIHVIATASSSSVICAHPTRLPSTDRRRHLQLPHLRWHSATLKPSCLVPHHSGVFLPNLIVSPCVLASDQLITSLVFKLRLPCTEIQVISLITGWENV